MIPIVTIDGPSGAGKGTVCRHVAQKTGYSLLDSGALYRLTALASLNANIDLTNESDVALCAKNLAVEFVAQDDASLVMLDGENVTREIRTERVGMTASKVAAFPEVRAALLQRQRDFHQTPGLIADGRDMGSVVFPEAGVKIFLTASASERANRRVKQLHEAGQTANYDTILADIEARDKQDRERASAPLIAAEGAIELDSTAMSIEEVVAAVMTEIEKKYMSN